MIFSQRSWLLLFLWWASLTAFHIWILSSAGFTTEIIIVESVSSTGILAAFSMAVSFPVRYYRPRDSRILFLAAWALILSLIWVFILITFLKMVFLNSDYLAFLERTQRIRAVIGFVILSSFIAIAYLVRHTRSQQEEESFRLQLEKQSREAELTSLRQQLQPHFLFNTLNSINSLIGSKPEQAREMTRKLSEFLRGTLTSQEEMITLKDELDHLKLYLEIEEVRFGHRLSTNIICPNEALSIRVPRLILQPLVENAIKFGLYDTVDKVDINIKCSISEGMLNINITNPFDPSTTYPFKGTGFGISSVKRKLFLIYNRPDLLETSSTTGQFSVTVKIPYLT